MDPAAVPRRAFLRRAAFAGGVVMTAGWLGRSRAVDLPTEVIASSAPSTALLANHALLAPPIVTRAEWGANEALRHTRPRFGGLDAIVVHHTTTIPTNDPFADAREVYRLHLKRDEGRWGDIGYHFLIHPNGRIYEGRRARDYAEGELHDGHDLDGRFLRGIHARGANDDTAGIALIGDFRSVRPTVPALAALTQLSAWLCDRHGIDPTSEGAIIGHQDACQTACPGDMTYELLPRVREWVSTRLLSPANSAIERGFSGSGA